MHGEMHTSILTRRRVLIGSASLITGLAFVPAMAAESKTGVIMVGASWCPYCKAAAEQLYVATFQWGWPVLIASLDNRAIAPFDHFFPSQDHVLTRDVARLPTTLIVAPSHDRIIAAFEGFDGPLRYLGQLGTAIKAVEQGEIS